MRSRLQNREYAKENLEYVKKIIQMRFYILEK